MGGLKLASESDTAPLFSVQTRVEQQQPWHSHATAMTMRCTLIYRGKQCTTWDRIHGSSGNARSGHPANLSIVAEWYDCDADSGGMRGCLQVLEAVPSGGDKLHAHACTAACRRQHPGRRDGPRQDGTGHLFSRYQLDLKPR